MEFSILTHLGVFAAMVVLDFAWAEYAASVTERKAHTSAFLSIVIMVFSGLVTTAYIHNIQYLVTAGIGAYLGTWISVAWKIHREKKQ
jgi:hypothetical protein